MFVEIDGIDASKVTDSTVKSKDFFMFEKNISDSIKDFCDLKDGSLSS